MSTAINPKGPRVIPAEISPLGWAQTYLTSTVGQKVIVALTGTLLVGFVVFHMIGNLKMFSGQDAVNAYAYFLKHELGALLWIARGGLLALFVTHVALTLRLKAKSAAARPIPYIQHRAAQASIGSRTMLWTGLVIGAFTVFHIAHFTLGWVKPAEVRDGEKIFTKNYIEMTDAKGRHDVYNMVIAGFRNSTICTIYLIAQALLFVHLSHGIQSVFQTLGLKSTQFVSAWSALAYVVAGTVFIGNLAIVAAVWTGYVS